MSALRSSIPGMSELQKLAEMNDVATGAAVGGGLGAAGGLLVTLLKEKPTLKKGLTNMLIGSTSGAAIGGGTMALKQISEGGKQPEGEKAPEPQLAEAPKKEPKHIDMASAAKHGLLPIAGAAIQGHEAGGGLQALISGGSSAGGMVAGTALADLIRPSGKANHTSLLPMALALAGSVGGSMGAAHMFNEREKAAAEKMDLATAALMGDPTGLTAALHGYSAGGKEQAIRSGMASAGSGIYGGMLGLLISALSRGKVGKGLGYTGGALLGSSGGSAYAANEFNKGLREKAAGAEDVGRSIDQAATT